MSALHLAPITVMTSAQEVAPTLTFVIANQSLVSRVFICTNGIRIQPGCALRIQTTGDQPYFNLSENDAGFTATETTPQFTYTEAYI